MYIYNIKYFSYDYIISNRKKWVNYHDYGVTQ